MFVSIWIERMRDGHPSYFFLRKSLEFIPYNLSNIILTTNII